MEFKNRKSAGRWEKGGLAQEGPRRVDQSWARETRGEDLRVRLGARWWDSWGRVGPLVRVSLLPPPPAPSCPSHLAGARGAFADAGQHCALRVPRVRGATARAALAARRGPVATQRARQGAGRWRQLGHHSDRPAGRWLLPVRSGEQRGNRLCRCAPGGGGARGAAQRPDSGHSHAAEQLCCAGGLGATRVAQRANHWLLSSLPKGKGYVYS